MRPGPCSQIHRAISGCHWRRSTDSRPLLLQHLRQPRGLRFHLPPHAARQFPPRGLSWFHCRKRHRPQERLSRYRPRWRSASLRLPGCRWFTLKAGRWCRGSRVRRPQLPSRQSPQLHLLPRPTYGAASSRMQWPLGIPSLIRSHESAARVRGFPFQQETLVLQPPRPRRERQLFPRYKTRPRRCSPRPGQG